MRKKTENLADTVYFSLRNKILRGEMLSGTALREEVLSEVFEVSRTPLRKALTQLTAEGYLVKGKDRTLRIPVISHEEVRDALAARKLLETAAVEAATANATDEDIKRLEHFIWDEEEALKVHDSLLVASVDRMFHNYLAQTSGNKVYEEFIGQLGYKMSLYLSLSNTLGDAIREALSEHRAILKAVKTKKPQLAGEAMKTHLDNVEARMLSGFEKERSKSAEDVFSSACNLDKIKKKGRRGVENAK